MGLVWGSSCQSDQELCALTAGCSVPQQIIQPKVRVCSQCSCWSTGSALGPAPVPASPPWGSQPQPQRFDSSNAFPFPAGCLPCGDAEHYSPDFWPSPELFLLENTKASLSKPQKNHLVKIWARDAKWLLLWRSLHIHFLLVTNAFQMLACWLQIAALGTWLPAPVTLLNSWPAVG